MSFPRTLAAAVGAKSIPISVGFAPWPPGARISVLQSMSQVQAVEVSGAIHVFLGMKELPPDFVHSFTFQAPLTVTVAGVEPERNRAGESAAAAATSPQLPVSAGGSDGGSDGPTALPEWSRELDHVESSSRVDEILAGRDYPRPSVPLPRAKAASGHASAPESQLPPAPAAPEVRSSGHEASQGAAAKRLKVSLPSGVVQQLLAQTFPVPPNSPAEAICVDESPEYPNQPEPKSSGANPPSTSGGLFLSAYGATGSQAPSLPEDAGAPAGPPPSPTLDGQSSPSKGGRLPGVEDSRSQEV